MKKMKRILAALLALVMCLGMAITASASTTNENDGKVTLSLSNGDTHTYEIYQIFTGDAAKIEGETKWRLSNVKYGQSYVPEGKKAGDAVPIADLEAITDARTFAESIKDIVNNPVGNISGTDTLDVVPGYYMLKDTTEIAEGANDTRSAFVVQIAGGNKLQITPKRNTVPVPEKTVGNGNDPVSSDYSVGDSVNFTLKATLGDLSEYKTYKLEFVDTMDAGLTYNSITEVKVGDNTITSGYTSTTEENSGKTVLKVTFDDVKAEAVGANSNSVITVTYTANLNDKAVFRTENGLKLNFSNDPTSDTTGTTSEDKVTVYTFTLDFTKVRKAESNETGDTNGKMPLNGAGFTLYKKNSEGNYIKFGDEQIKTESNTFTFTGLGTGDYKLEETTVPAGYNKMEDKEFTIAATVSEETGVTELRCEALSTAGWNVTATDGKIAGSIENQKGAELPSTGGIGTTIFYVIGGLLVVGAGVLLITKKRMGREE